MKAWAVFLVVCFLFLSMPASHAQTTTTKRLADGVTLVQQIDSNPPLAIDELIIDPTVPGVHIGTALGQGTVTGPTGDIHKGRGSVTQAQAANGAVAAVNGDFFPFTGDPLGVGVTNGRLYSEPYYAGRAAMGVTDDGRRLLLGILSYLGDLQAADGSRYPLGGVDRMVSATDLSDLVVFSQDYGPVSGGRMGATEVVLGNVNLPLSIDKLMKGTVRQVIVGAKVATSIPADGVVLSAPPGGPAAAFLNSKFHVGDNVEFLCAVAPKPALTDAVKLALAPPDSQGLPSRASGLDRGAVEWAAVTQAIGGGPELVVNGQIAVDATQEGFDDSFTNDPNPRTAIGQTAGGKILLVTVDGRQSLSKGVSLGNLARIMRRLGALNAMNLDGGGSTTMAARGMVVNWPSGTGAERPVADMVLVYAGSDPDPPSGSAGGASSFSLSAPAQTVSVGQSEKIAARLGSTPIDGDDPSLLWSGTAGDGVGVVTQDGVFHAVRPGTAMVRASYRGQDAQVQVTVTGSAPAAANYTIQARLVAAPDGAPNRSELVVRIVDQAGMPLQNGAVHISVHGGTPDNTDITTSADGTAQTGITWEGAAGAVTVSSGTIAPVSVNYPVAPAAK